MFYKQTKIDQIAREARSLRSQYAEHDAYWSKFDSNLNMLSL